MKTQNGSIDKKSQVSCFFESHHSRYSDFSFRFVLSSLSPLVLRLETSKSWEVKICPQLWHTYDLVSLSYSNVPPQSPQYGSSLPPLSKQLLLPADCSILVFACKLRRTKPAETYLARSDLTPKYRIKRNRAITIASH